MQVALELVRSVRSRHPGEIEALYRRGTEYLYVWTIPAELATDPQDEDRLAMAVLCGRDGATPAERTVAFRADSAGTITDWTPVASAAGDASRTKVLAELDGQQEGGAAR